MMMKKLMNEMIGFRAVSKRTAYLKILAKLLNISLISVYAPKEKMYDMEKEEFNTQIMKEEYITEISEKFPHHEKTNDHGDYVP